MYKKYILGFTIVIFLIIGSISFNKFNTTNIDNSVELNDSFEETSEEIIEDSFVIEKESYLGDIHFQLGLGEKDKLKVEMNNLEVFNSEINSEKGNFQIQIFKGALIGNNIFDITFEDNDDGQPLVLFVIQDGVKTLVNWEPNEKLISDSFEVTIE